MSDPIFQDFYNNVRDPSWPDAFSYKDFISLPDSIQNECLDLHNGINRLEEITNQNYWNNSRITNQVGWKYKNLIFIPLLKCGLYYYEDLFCERLKWEKHLLSPADCDKFIIISCIIHPFTKYLKGITEWIWLQRDFLRQTAGSLENAITLLLRQEFLMPDTHAIPYHLTLPGIIDKMTLIPADIMEDWEVRQNLMDIFQTAGHGEIVLPLGDERMHESGPEKLRIFNLVQQAFNSKPDCELLLIYQLFSEDLKLYKNLVDNFSKSRKTKN